MKFRAFTSVLLSSAVTASAARRRAFLSPIGGSRLPLATSSFQAPPFSHRQSKFVSYPLGVRGGSIASIDDEDDSENTTKRNKFLRTITTDYRPNPDATTFLDRLQEKTVGNVSVKVSVLSNQESKRFFGVSLAKRGIQPVWVEVDNTKGNTVLFLDRVKLDPNYYPSREASMVCHFANLKRLASYGFLSWVVFFPLAVLLPLKLITAGSANRKMDEFFLKHSFPLGLIEAGTVKQGFVFCSLDDGTKVVTVDLLSAKTNKSLIFSVPVPGLAVDYSGKDPLKDQQLETMECETEDVLRERLENEPRAVTNKRGTKEGDPANLVVVGDFNTLLTAFGSRWDETEVISIQTCIKTAESFVLGSQYRYSPVSALYMYGRSQDIALQRARGSISERLHLRLWLTPLTFEGRPVWVGQVSRDIGVRLAKTWNLTTHKIDPNVDEARDYVAADVRQAGHLDRLAYCNGVGESTEEDPRVNLTGDPFVTNGKRAVIILSPTKTNPKILSW